jgi:quercetin dioxygenase-like cupin family protein
MSGWTDEERRLADRFRELGFSFDIWSDPPGRAWRGFVHSTDELVVLLEGEVEFVVGGVVHRPETGEELLIPAGVVHDAVNIGRTTNRWAYGYRR